MSRLATLLTALALAAQLATAQQDPAIRTIRQVNAFPTGFPPHGGSWSPDGKIYTFEASDDATLNGAAHVGEPGDIIQIEAATGRASVLATVAQLSALSAAEISEKDRDHRNRYSMPDYLWAADSRHLLIDNNGRLWLYDIASGKGQLIVNSSSPSGDDPKFSPDGRSISYQRDHNLFVHPLLAAPGVETALTTTKDDAILNGEVDWVYLEELEVRSNYFWSPDSASIAYLQMDETRVPQFPLVDWVPTHAEVDAQRYPQPGDPNPAVRVGVVPATGGATRWIVLPFSPNNDYIPRFGWVDAKTLYIEVLTRDNQRLNLYFADAATGRTKLVHTETDAKYLEDNYDVSFLPGMFFNTSWKDGHTHLYLYSFDAAHPLDAEAKLVRQLTHGDYEVTTPEAHGNTIFYSSNEGSLFDSNLWSISLDGTHKQKLTTGTGVHEPGVSSDGKHFADVASSGTDEPIASLCTIGQACIPFWRSRPLAPARGVVSSRVTFTAADGKTPLYGILTEPAGKTPGSVPIILNPYGGPLPFSELPNSWRYGAMLDELFAQHGFAVLNLENRGQGGRGRDFQQAAYRNFGPVQFSDQMAALDQTLAAHPELDPKRVGWWGWSWGGSFTLYAMTHTGRIKAGVSVAPPADFRNYDSIYTERYLGLPTAPNSPYEADDAVTSAANLKGRLLLVQGTGDDNVHLSNIVQFIDSLIENGIPYDLQIFPRKTHSLAGNAARTELYNRILSHFETYLK